MLVVKRKHHNHAACSYSKSPTLLGYFISTLSWKSPCIAQLADDRPIRVIYNVRFCGILETETNRHNEDDRNDDGTPNGTMQYKYQTDKERLVWNINLKHKCKYSTTMWKWNMVSITKSPNWRTDRRTSRLTGWRTHWLTDMSITKNN